MSRWQPPWTNFWWILTFQCLLSNLLALSTLWLEEEVALVPLECQMAWYVSLSCKFCLKLWKTVLRKACCHRKWDVIDDLSHWFFSLACSNKPSVSKCLLQLHHRHLPTLALGQATLIQVEFTIQKELGKWFISCYSQTCQLSFTAFIHFMSHCLSQWQWLRARRPF